MPPLSPRLEQRLREHPLQWASDCARVLAGDLDFASRRYALLACSRGTGWDLWWEIQAARGTADAAGIEALTREQLPYFCAWAYLQPALASFACDAYGKWLRGVEARQLTGPGVVEYLQVLLSLGRADELLREVEHLSSRVDDLPEEEAVAVRAEFALGDGEAAARRLRRIRGRHHDDGRLWALTAILRQRRGDPDRARSALAEGAKLGVYDENLLAEMLAELGVSPESWRAARAPWEPCLSYDEETAKWAAEPGAGLVPSSEPGPHWYGGTEFTLPACVGCGHPIRQWFVIDVREVEPLRRLLPGWGLFPLLGCADCSVSVGRHDYRLDEGTRSLELESVGISARLFGRAVGVVPPLPRAFAALEWRSPRKIRTAEEFDDLRLGWEPQVAGVPSWTQQALRVFCRACRTEMCFVAAMATAKRFSPIVVINNGSGYQYHFACGPCRRISVIAQFT